MILFLYGTDTFRSLSKLKKIIQSNQEKNENSLNLIDIDFQQDSHNVLRDALRSKSMFCEKKLIIVRNAFASEANKKKILGLKKILSCSPDIIVFFEKGKIDKKDPLFLFLKKEGKSQEFKPLSEPDLKIWLKDETEKYFLEMPLFLIDKLIKRVGKNLWALENEIRKIAAWKGASKNKKAIVSQKDLDLFVKPSIKKDIFKTIDAIASQKKAEALRLLSSHINKGDSPGYIMAMISWQITRLLAVKQKTEKGESVYGLGWHPYVVRKSYALGRKFDFESLKKIHDTILELDIKIKTGQIDPQLALDLLIAKISLAV